jgi:hypothetical protein
VKGQSEKKKMKKRGIFFFLGHRANSLESSLIDALEQVTTTFTPGEKKKRFKITQIDSNKIQKAPQHVRRNTPSKRKILRSDFPQKTGAKKSRYFQIDPKRFRMAIDQNSEHLKTDHAAMVTKISAIFPAKNIFKNNLYHCNNNLNSGRKGRYGPVRLAHGAASSV